MEKTYNAFQEMKIVAIDKQHPMPYLYNYYNVSFHNEMKFLAGRNALANIRNSLVSALNEKKNKLPRFIVIIPDDDILKFINYYAFGISTIMGKCLNWLITEVDRLISARKDALCHRKPGAVLPNEPKIVWCKMMDKPNMTYNDMMVVHGKYNRILEEILTQYQGHYILDYSKEVVHPVNFSQQNDINARGKEDMWNVIDRKLEIFDFNKDYLLPHTAYFNTSHIPVQRVKPEQHTRIQHGSPVTIDYNRMDQLHHSGNQVFSS